MSKGIKKIVCHHLGFATRSTGKIHQHGVVVGIYISWTHKGSGIFHSCLPRMKTLWHIWTDANKRFYRRTVGHCALHLLEYIFFAHTNNGFNTSTIVAINNVVGGEHVCCWNGNSTQFAKCQHGNPPFVLTFKDEHHHVATTNTQLLEIRSSAIAFPFKVGKRENTFSSFIASPYKRSLFGCFYSPRIHHIVGKIKVIWNKKFEISVIIFC